MRSDYKEHCCKPVSVQAMWSALQALVKVVEVAKQNSYYPNSTSLTHAWVTYYRAKLTKDPSYINEW